MMRTVRNVRGVKQRALTFVLSFLREGSYAIKNVSYIGLTSTGGTHGEHIFSDDQTARFTVLGQT